MKEYEMNSGDIITLEQDSLLKFSSFGDEGDRINIDMKLEFRNLFLVLYRN